MGTLSEWVFSLCYFCAIVKAEKRKNITDSIYIYLYIERI